MKRRLFSTLVLSAIIALFVFGRAGSAYAATTPTVTTTPSPTVTTTPSPTVTTTPSPTTTATSTATATSTPWATPTPIFATVSPGALLDVPSNGWVYISNGCVASVSTTTYDHYGRSWCFEIGTGALYYYLPTGPNSGTMTCVAKPGGC